MYEPRTIKDALKGFLKESGLSRKIRNRNVYETWEKVVGDEIAKKTRVVKYERGTLTVEVEGSGLFSELEKYYLDDVLASLQAEMDNRKVRKIKLRLGNFKDDTDGEKKRQRQKRSPEEDKPVL